MWHHKLMPDVKLEINTSIFCWFWINLSFHIYIHTNAWTYHQPTHTSTCTVVNNFLSGTDEGGKRGWSCKLKLKILPLSKGYVWSKESTCNEVEEVAAPHRESEAVCCPHPLQLPKHKCIYCHNIKRYITMQTTLRYQQYCLQTNWQLHWPT